jgi:ElaB/YqjD/DUF883 family membrane-anchored ribosome-binding protein
MHRSYRLTHIKVQARPDAIFLLLAETPLEVIMARTDEAWREEISALRAEIEALKAQKSAAGDMAAEATAQARSAAQSAMEAAQQGLNDLIKQANDKIGELQGRFSEGTHMAEETVSQHPFAMLASAFVLGMVIGRLAR